MFIQSPPSSRGCHITALHSEVRLLGWGCSDALDWKLMHRVLQDLKNGKVVQIPHYCFKTHKRLATSDTIDGNAVDVVVVEGYVLLMCVCVCAFVLLFFCILFFFFFSIFKPKSSLFLDLLFFFSVCAVFSRILALWSSDIRALLDMKVFVDADADLRLARRGADHHTSFLAACTTVFHVCTCEHTWVGKREMLLLLQQHRTG